MDTNFAEECVGRCQHDFRAFEGSWVAHGDVAYQNLLSEMFTGLRAVYREDGEPLRAIIASGCSDLLLEMIAIAYPKLFTPVKE
jgi:hypothetical protein